MSGCYKVQKYSKSTCSVATSVFMVISACEFEFKLIFYCKEVGIVYIFKCE